MHSLSSKLEQLGEYTYHFIREPEEAIRLKWDKMLTPFIKPSKSTKEYLNSFFQDTSSVSSTVMILTKLGTSKEQEKPIALYALNKKKTHADLPFEYVRREYLHNTETKGELLEAWGLKVLTNEIDKEIFTNTSMRNCCVYEKSSPTRMQVTFNDFMQCTPVRYGQVAFSIYGRVGCTPKYTQQQSLMRYKLVSKYCQDVDNVPWGITTINEYSSFFKFIDRYCIVNNRVLMKVEKSLKEVNPTSNGKELSKYNYTEGQIDYLWGSKIK